MVRTRDWKALRNRLEKSRNDKNVNELFSNDIAIYSHINAKHNHHHNDFFHKLMRVDTGTHSLPLGRKPREDREEGL